MSHEQSVKVWDPLLRIFHWSLVLLFIISYATGEEESAIHAWSGYGIVALLIFRFIWGVVGPKYARFTNFVYSPAEIMAYSRDLLVGNAKRYIGHNPLGGLMVVALLLSLSMTTFTGMMLYGAEEGKGPLAGVMQAELSVPQLIATAQADDDEYESYEYEHGMGSMARHEDEEEHELLEEVHEFFANFTVFLIVIHIMGVMFESFVHRESLVSAMFSGYKKT